MSHGHPDHFSGLKKIRKSLGVKIVLTEKTADIIRNKNSFRKSFNADSYKDYFIVQKGIKHKMSNFIRGLFSNLFFKQIYGLSYIADPDEIITENTEILINTISKHVIRFGLIEAEKNKNLPDIVKEVIKKELLKQKDKKKFGTALYISFGDFVNAKCIKILFKATDNLFVLLKKEVFENISKIGLINIQNTSIFNRTIREPDNFFDAVIIPYHFKSTNLKDVTKEIILKEAFRIVKEKGVVIIHGYTELPNIEHALLNIFIKWVKNVYTDIETSSEKKFKDEMLKAGATEVEVFVYKGHLFGIGRK